MSGVPILSFVLPARNEERYVGDAIAAIKAWSPDGHSSEVVVVDNGSTDRTVELARAAGAYVVEQPAGTIAALRNRGVAQTHAPVLVFLDADVMLTPAWGREIGRVIDTLLRTPDLVTGSRCGIGSGRSRIERIWFEPLQGEHANYVNSGHLLTSRQLFERLGGFDASRETGEDSDFSSRARALGANIVNDPALEVIHEGYPKTLAQFFRRERWHGRGNFQSLRAVVASRIAPLAIAFALSHAMLLAAGLLRSPLLAAAGAGAILAICVGSAAAKYRRLAPRRWPLAAPLYYVYFAARSLALADTLVGRAAGSRHR